MDRHNAALLSVLVSGSIMTERAWKNHIPDGQFFAKPAVRGILHFVFLNSFRPRKRNKSQLISAVVAGYKVSKRSVENWIGDLADQGFIEELCHPTSGRETILEPTPLSIEVFRSIATDLLKSVSSLVRMLNHYDGNWADPLDYRDLFTDFIFDLHDEEREDWEAMLRSHPPPSPATVSDALARTTDEAEHDQGPILEEAVFESSLGFEPYKPAFADESTGMD